MKSLRSDSNLHPFVFTHVAEWVMTPSKYRRDLSQALCAFLICATHARSRISSGETTSCLRGSMPSGSAATAEGAFDVDESKEPTEDPPPPRLLMKCVNWKLVNLASQSFKSSTFWDSTVSDSSPVDRFLGEPFSETRCTRKLYGH